jgi:hypothetical protein
MDITTRVSRPRHKGQGTTPVPVATRRTAKVDLATTSSSACGGVTRSYEHVTASIAMCSTHVHYQPTACRTITITGLQQNCARVAI